MFCFTLWILTKESNLEHVKPFFLSHSRFLLPAILSPNREAGGDNTYCVAYAFSQNIIN